MRWAAHTDCDWGMNDNAICPKLPELTRTLMAKARAMTKSLQTEHRFGMLVALQQEAQPGVAGRTSLEVIGETLKGPRQLQSTKGSTVFAALARSDGLSPDAGAFLSKWRVAAADGASSNEVANSMTLQPRRGPGWQRTKWLCEVHRVATAHTGTFDLVDSTTSGLIRLSLSLSASAAASVFVNVFERPHSHPALFPQRRPSCRSRLVNIFLSSGPNRSYWKTLQTYLANGEWDRQSVQYFAQPREDHPLVPQKSADGLTCALRGSQISVVAARGGGKGQMRLLPRLLSSIRYTASCQRHSQTFARG